MISTIHPKLLKNQQHKIFECPIEVSTVNVMIKQSNKAIKLQIPDLFPQEETHLFIIIEMELLDGIIGMDLFDKLNIVK